MGGYELLPSLHQLRLRELESSTQDARARNENLPGAGSAVDARAALSAEVLRTIERQKQLQTQGVGMGERARSSSPVPFPVGSDSTSASAGVPGVPLGALSDEGCSSDVPVMGVGREERFGEAAAPSPLGTVTPALGSSSSRTAFADAPSGTASQALDPGSREGSASPVPGPTSSLSPAPAPAPAPALEPGDKVLMRVVALFDFDSDQPGDLCFKVCACTGLCRVYISLSLCLCLYLCRRTR